MLSASLNITFLSFLPYQQNDKKTNKQIKTPEVHTDHVKTTEICVSRIMTENCFLEHVSDRLCLTVPDSCMLKKKKRVYLVNHLDSTPHSFLLYLKECQFYHKF